MLYNEQISIHLACARWSVEATVARIDHLHYYEFKIV